MENDTTIRAGVSARRDAERDAARPARLWIRCACLAATAVGMYLAVSQFLSGRSFWVDEAYLALNVIELGARDFFSPLPYDQVAPPFFMIAVKAAGKIFGYTEAALRLVPLVSALAAGIIFYPLALRLLKGPSALYATLLFALNSSFLYYASEMKPYATDLLFATALTLIGIDAAASVALGWRRTVALAVGGALSIWFSFGAAFVLAAVGTGLLFSRLARRAFREVGAVAVIGAAWAASFYVLNVVLLKAVSENGYFGDFHKPNFMPFPPLSMADLRWFLRNFFDFFERPGGLQMTGLAAFFFLYGVAATARKSPVVLWMLAVPTITALACSGVGKYPFTSRLLLFAVPGIVVLTAAGVGRVAGILAAHSKPAAVLLAGLLLLHPAVSAGYRLRHPRTKQELGRVLEEVAEQRKPGDFFYVYYASHPAFLYYNRTFKIDRDDYVIGAEDRRSGIEYVNDMRGLVRRKRVWLVFSHVFDGEDRLMLAILRTKGVELKTIGKDGATAHLFEFVKNDEGTAVSGPGAAADEIEPPWARPDQIAK